MSLNTTGFKTYIELDKKKKALTTELDETTQEMKRIQEALIENLELNEMSKIQIAGKTCYIKNSTYAVISSKEQAIDILKSAGYDDYIKEGYNTNSISKLIRDLLEEDGELPELFGDIITKGTRSDLSVINS